MSSAYGIHGRGRRLSSPLLGRLYGAGAEAVAVVRTLDRCLSVPIREHQDTLVKAGCALRSCERRARAGVTRYRLPWPTDGLSVHG